jgi:hypothetical protein
MVKFYQKWTVNAIRRVRESNSMHVSLDSKWRCHELIAALYARSIIWRQLLHNFRIASKANEAETNSFKFCKYVQAMYAHAEQMEVDPSFLLESDFVAFDFSTADASISIISERYRKFYGNADACAMSPPPEARQIIL